MLLLSDFAVLCRTLQRPSLPYFAATQHWVGVLLLRCTKTNKTNISPSRRNKTVDIYCVAVLSVVAFRSTLQRRNIWAAFCCVAALTIGSAAQPSKEPSSKPSRRESFKTRRDGRVLDINSIILPTVTHQIRQNSA